jgi:hypothetical protein
MTTREITIGSETTRGTMEIFYEAAVEAAGGDPQGHTFTLVCVDPDAPSRPYDEEIHVFLDGNAWTANRAKGYTDMMECPTGFGDTPQDAVTSLLAEEEK